MRTTFNHNSFILLLGLAAALWACRKNDVPPPSYQDAVYFYKLQNAGMGDGTDSAGIAKAFTGEYSFFFLDRSRQQDTFWLPSIRIMGRPASYNRRIDLIALDTSTAIAGKHYRLLDYVMPADSFSVRAGVILLRTDDLADTTRRLVLQLRPSADFPGPVMEDSLTADHRFYFGNTFTIDITGRAIQPPYWLNVSLFMGPWSRVKYEFIVSVLGLYLGVTDNPDEVNNLYSYYLRVKSALAQYNLDHPDAPLMDENGNYIFF